MAVAAGQPDGQLLGEGLAEAGLARPGRPVQQDNLVANDNDVLNDKDNKYDNDNHLVTTDDVLVDTGISQTHCGVDKLEQVLLQ